METQVHSGTTASKDPDYGVTRRFPGLPLDEAKRMITEALAGEGFGVLTEIDVRATMKKKLGVDFQPYVILGACNPGLAHRALTAELGVGLLLPCNVCVWEEEGGTSVVSIVKPAAMLQVASTPELRPIADEADRKLRAALARMTG